MLWAKTGLGKTMLALTIALAVAGGGKVAGWTFDKPRPVLVLDGEMHIQDLRDRLNMLGTTIEGFDADAADKNLVVLSRQHQDAEVLFPDLANPQGQDAILSRATGMQAALVIADNFSTLAEVADENEAAAMTPVLTFLMRMKQAGIATILVHHSEKTGSTYRGSSKLATTFEAIMGLLPIDGRSVLDGTGFELRFDKFRGKPTPATRNAEMVLLEGPEGALKWDVKPAQSAEMAAMLDAVRSGDFTSQNDLARHLGWDKTKVSKMKARAISKNEITLREWSVLMSPEGGPNDDF